MAELALSMEIEAPPEAVFDAFTDWAAQHEWMAGTQVRVTAGDGRSTGSRFLARTGVGPLGFDDPMEITAWEPPRRVQVHHLGRVVRGDGVFEVEPLPNGRSRFNWVEWLEIPLGTVGLVGFTVARPVLARGIQPSLRKFARWVERRTP